jgi:dTDP-glucose 4,6-dehydratase
MKYLVTGGAGFIGSNFIRHLLESTEDVEIVNLDNLSYAGNLDNLKDVEKDKRYKFIKGDICDPKLTQKAANGCDIIVNFAAESHVDRSINTPGSFITTDTFGTHVLLEAARKYDAGFVQISTDEVYGSINEGSFFETSQLNPSSPYSASKAGGELIAKAYFSTYGIPVLITRSSNNLQMRWKIRNSRFMVMVRRLGIGFLFGIIARQ